MIPGFGARESRAFHVPFFANRLIALWCCMADSTDFKKALALMNEHVTALQREFGHVLSGKRMIANAVHYPKHPDVTKQVRSGVCSLLEGSLLVYLFAMWEVHTPKDVNDWLTEAERRKLNAFRHVRDSVAHGFQGTRAHRPNRRKAFESEMPFAGIVWNEEVDTIDISESAVARECFEHMKSVTGQLVVRLHAGKKPAGEPDLGD